MAYRTEQEALEARRLVEAARARVRSSVLSNVRIASPCAASWDDMVGDDQVRHCNACDKDVFNLSHMTRADAERVVEATNGRLCARYFRRADGTMMTADCSVGAGHARRRKLVVAGVTLMIAAAGAIAHERTPPAAEQDPVVDEIAAGTEELVPSVRVQALEAAPPPAAPAPPTRAAPAHVDTPAPSHGAWMGGAVVSSFVGE